MEKEKKDTKFKKGNTIGAETRFKPGNTLSKKYVPEYADDLLQYFEDRGNMDNPELPTLEGWAIDKKICISSVYVWIKDCFDNLNVFEIQKDYDDKTYRYFVGEGGMDMDGFVDLVFGI